MKLDAKLQRHFFDQEKNQYQTRLLFNPPYHTQREQNTIVERLKGLKKGEMIVDFGSGTGRISVALLQKGFKVRAVDISKKSLKALQKVIKTQKLNQSIFSTKLPKRKVKAIVGADILHHINLDNYLPLIYKSLVRGGKVVFSEPCAFNISWYLYLPIAADWRVEKGVMTCTYFNLKKKFANSGFRDITITGLGFFPRPFFNWSKTFCRLNDYIGNLPFLRLFAYRYIIEAYKLPRT